MLKKQTEKKKKNDRSVKSYQAEGKETGQVTKKTNEEKTESSKNTLTKKREQITCIEKNIGFTKFTSSNYHRDGYQFIIITFYFIYLFLKFEFFYLTTKKIAANNETSRIEVESIRFFLFFK